MAGPVPNRLSARCLPNQYAGTPRPPSSVPELVASMICVNGTTALLGSASTLRRPPDMSLTFFAQSVSISWKMSCGENALCIFQVIVCCACPPGDCPGAFVAWVVGGAFCERHAVASDASPDTDAYLSRFLRSKGNLLTPRPSGRCHKEIPAPRFCQAGRDFRPAEAAASRRGAGR